MFHANTERMIEHWIALKGDLPAPARSAIDPGAFASLLPQVFILGRLQAGRYVVRLAGGLVDTLHGGGIRGGDPIALWSEPHRTSLALALEAARREPAPLVVTAEGRTSVGQSLMLEVMLAPLAGARGEVDRVIGLYQPTTPVADLMGRPVATLTMRSIAVARAEALPRLRLAAIDGRQIA